MKTTDELVVEMGLDKAREFIAENAHQYIEEVWSLITKQKVEGIRFGRCFISDKNVREKLQEICDNETLDLGIRVQALYEILTENQTPSGFKETWLSFLLKNHIKFEAICKIAYSLNTDDDRNNYFEKLIQNKIINTPANKKWLYLVEIVILYKINNIVTNIINEQLDDRGDSFLNIAGKKCLEFLKTE